MKTQENVPTSPYRQAGTKATNDVQDLAKIVSLVSGLQVENNGLKQQVAFYENQLKMALSRAKQIENSKEGKKTEIDELTSKLQEFSEKNQLLELQNHNSNVKNQELQNQLGQEAKEISRLLEEKKTLEGKLISMDKQIEQSIKDRKLITDEAESTLKKLDRTKEENQALIKEKKDLIGKNLESEDKITDLDRQLSSEKTELKKYKERNTSLQDKYKFITNELEETKTKLEEHVKSEKTLNTQLNIIAKEKNNSEQEFVEKIKKSDELIGGLQNSLNEAQARIQDLKENLEIAIEDRDALYSSIMTVTEVIHATQDKVDSFNAANANKDDNMGATFEIIDPSVIGLAISPLKPITPAKSKIPSLSAELEEVDKKNSNKVKKVLFEDPNATWVEKSGANVSNSESEKFVDKLEQQKSSKEEKDKVPNM